MTASASENFASRGSSRPRRAPTAATRAAPRSFPPVLGNTFDEMPRRASSLAPKTRERLAGHPDLEGFANALEADQSRLIKDVAQNRQKPHESTVWQTRRDRLRKTDRLLAHHTMRREEPPVCHTKGRPAGRPSRAGGEARIRTGGQGFAGPCLTTWPLRRMKKAEHVRPGKAWSGLRGSNPRPQPWQGCALPTALARKSRNTIRPRPDRASLPRTHVKKS